MTPQVFGKLLHRLVTTLGLFTQGHQHDVIQVTEEPALQSRRFRRAFICHRKGREGLFHFAINWFRGQGCRRRRGRLAFRNDLQNFAGQAVLETKRSIAAEQFVKQNSE